MHGYRFSKYIPPPDEAKSDFEKLLKIFMQLILITAGNVAETLQWLTELDRQYGLTNSNYGIRAQTVDLIAQVLLSGTRSDTPTPEQPGRKRRRAGTAYP